ncbi:MAG TPA: hypothetical protein VHD33_04445, partial [Legionellaceae bacterium]|nr:hypothetical protein [Legionellaceae bacterium]
MRTQVVEKSFMVIGTMCFILLLTIISYYGNPITDESFPSAIALRFIQGQKPFIDDYSPFIPIGLFLLPLVKLSLLLHHGKNELILFMRHSFIVFQFGLALYAFINIKKYLPTILAFGCAALIFIYHPFGLNSFHYDTLCTGLWSVIAFQSINLITQKPSLYSYVLYSCLGMVLCFAYPTFSIYLVFFYTLIYCSIKEKKVFLLSNSIVILFTASMLAITLFYGYGIRHSDIVHGFQAGKPIFSVYAHHSILNKSIALFQNLTPPYFDYVLISICTLLIGKFFLKKKSTLFILLSGLFLFPL